MSQRIRDFVQDETSLVALSVYFHIMISQYRSFVHILAFFAALHMLLFRLHACVCFYCMIVHPVGSKLYLITLLFVCYNHVLVSCVADLPHG